MAIRISEVRAARGVLAQASIPGRGGAYRADLQAYLDWRPDLVLSMVETEEFAQVGAGGFLQDLARADIAVCRFPVRDFGVPGAAAEAQWAKTSRQARSVLAAGGRVLTHCFGGNGRSGMAMMRLLVELGEPADLALMRLRLANPAAVETPAQEVWAGLGVQL